MSYDRLCCQGERRALLEKESIVSGEQSCRWWVRMLLTKVEVQREVKIRSRDFGLGTDRADGRF